MTNELLYRQIFVSMGEESGGKTEMKKTLAFLGLISTIGGTALAAVPANVQAATVNVSTPTTSYATQSYQQDFINKIKAHAQNVRCNMGYIQVFKWRKQSWNLTGVAHN